MKLFIETAIYIAIVFVGFLFGQTYSDNILSHVVFKDEN